jgi:hypothetical protein
MQERLTISSGVSASYAKKVGCALAVLLAAAAAGCSYTPDQGIVTSSLTNQVGYSTPSKGIAQGKQAATQRTVKLVRTTYLGRAPYICTPSGFGSTSRCFLR